MTDTAPIRTVIAPAAAAPDRGSACAAPSHRTLFDRLGISVSLLCAVHCLAAPFLLLALPAAGAVWSHPLVHWGLALFVLPLALWVVFNGYKRHRQRWTLVAAGLGASLIVAGLILPMTNGSPLLSTTLPWLGEGGAAIAGNAPISPAADATACSETCCPSVTQDAATGSATLAIPPGGLVTLIGSLLLVFAHLTNLVGCRRLA